MMRHPPSPTLFPYTTLFRSHPSRASARRWALMVPVCTPEPSNTISRLVELTSSISVQVLRQHQWINQDRKSTRLNSSHVKISYAVFCLKKKKNKNDDTRKYT